MHEISNILAVVDPTAETQPAMHRAAWLAQHAGAKLELLICYYSAYLSGDSLFQSPSLDRARGAAAERTLEHLPCDLLIVKPDWFESPVSPINPDAARPKTTSRRHPSGSENR